MRHAAAVLLTILLAACAGDQPETTQAEESPGGSVETMARAYHGGFDDRTRGDLSAIGAALTQYLADAGSYPAASDIDGLAAQLEPAYSRALPRTDAWGQPFQYSSSGSGFTLISIGRDGASGTEDDLVLTEGGLQ